MSAVVMVIVVVFVIVSREGCHGYRRRTPVVEVAIDVVVIVVLNFIFLVALPPVSLRRRRGSCGCRRRTPAVGVT